MRCESYVTGEARGRDLAAQLLSKGFSPDGGDELLSPSGGSTGVIVSAGDQLTGREAWRFCDGFDGLITALHQVDGLESVELRREWQEDDKEGHVFRDGAWYTLVIVEEYVPEEGHGVAARAAKAALKQFDPACCAAPALGRRSGRGDSAPDAVRVLEAMYAYVAESPAGALVPDVSGGAEAELVALNEAIEALILLNGQAGGVNVDALARRAVNMMGDVFYDADQYGDEAVSCPVCGEDVTVRARSCPHCLAEFAEPPSRNQAIYEDTVGCVAWAIRQALAARSRSTLIDSGDPAFCRVCEIPLPVAGDTCAGCCSR